MVTIFVVTVFMVCIFKVICVSFQFLMVIIIMFLGYKSHFLWQQTKIFMVTSYHKI